jgi:DNA-directed RNA polymerase specialized sigma24 family protein
LFTTDLDTLLYEWLSEPDQRKAEQRFTRYFRAAFPEICRFLRAFRADAATAEDISQQALIKLFGHLGTERHAATVRLNNALSVLAPLAFGALHSRLVRGWREQVGGFRDAALRFRLPQEMQESSEACKELREEINGRVEPLQRQGTHFLREVREQVAPALRALIGPELAESNVRQDRSGAVAPQPEGNLGGGPADAVQAQVAWFVAALLRYAAGRDSAEVDGALGCAGAVGFVSRASTICETMPALAIPSNGLLYTIAKRLFLDSLRRKSSNPVESTDAPIDRFGSSVLDEWDDGFPGESHHAPDADAQTNPSVSDSAGCGYGEGTVERRYQMFLDFLRLPLTRAEGALAEAASRGTGKAEQKRVDSLRRKYARLVAVLAALHESPQPSEEEIARRQGITRNQVKYVIERVREEFSYFFPDLVRETRGRRKREGAET